MVVATGAVDDAALRLLETVPSDHPRRGLIDALGCGRAELGLVVVFERAQRRARATERKSSEREEDAARSETLRRSHDHSDHVGPSLAAVIGLRDRC